LSSVYRILGGISKAGAFITITHYIPLEVKGVQLPSNNEKGDKYISVFHGIQEISIRFFINYFKWLIENKIIDRQ